MEQAAESLGLPSGYPKLSRRVKRRTTDGYRCKDTARAQTLTGKAIQGLIHDSHADAGVYAGCHQMETGSRKHSFEILDRLSRLTTLPPAQINRGHCHGVRRLPR